MVPFSVCSVMVLSAVAASMGSAAGCLRQPVTATEDARETAPTMNGVS